MVCSIHGVAFGILYSPAQALMFGMNFKMMIAWIVSGFPFDLIHGIGNLFAGMLVMPLSELLIKIAKKQHTA